jgi:diguanylate cyclase (GGDEF)-like protein
MSPSTGGARSFTIFYAQIELDMDNVTKVAGGSVKGVGKASAKILVVDDAPTDVAILASIISDMATVNFALTGEDGLRRLAEEAFDVVLLDLLLPDIDGFEVLRRLNESAGDDRPAVIFVTVVDSPESEERGLNLGAVDYVSKPFVPAVVRARVRNHLLLSQTTKELRHANAMLSRLASIDTLTNVFNRRQFMISAHEEFSRADRHGYPIGLIMLDIDNFKRINDKFGHERGDVVLASVAATWEKELRVEDKLGRVGGEEFAVVVPGADAERTHLVAERLLAAARNLGVAASHGVELRVTASAGCAVRPASGDDLSAALRRADHALLSAKRGGRDRIAMADDREIGDQVTRGRR